MPDRKTQKRNVVEHLQNMMVKNIIMKELHLDIKLKIN